VRAIPPGLRENFLIVSPASDPRWGGSGRSPKPEKRRSKRGLRPPAEAIREGADYFGDRPTNHSGAQIRQQPRGQSREIASPPHKLTQLLPLSHFFFDH